MESAARCEGADRSCRSSITRSVRPDCRAPTSPLMAQSGLNEVMSRRPLMTHNGQPFRVSSCVTRSLPSQRVQRCEAWRRCCSSLSVDTAWSTLSRVPASKPDCCKCAQACRATVNSLSETSPPASSFVDGSRHEDKSLPAIAPLMARAKRKRAKPRCLIASSCKMVRSPKSRQKRDMKTLRVSQVGCFPDGHSVVRSTWKHTKLQGDREQARARRQAEIAFRLALLNNDPATGHRRRCQGNGDRGSGRSRQPIRSSTDKREAR